jgi:hypothetical protein
MILVTALPIRPNPLIATFVAIRKSPFLNTENAVFACLHCPSTPLRMVSEVEPFHNKRKGYFIDYLSVLQDFFTISCNISATGAIILTAMINVMAKSAGQSNTDDLVSLAHTDAEAFGRLYDLYYERIFRFCVHRLFYKETAEDVTSAIFLQVAQQIAGFKGQTQADFTTSHTDSAAL